MNYFTDVTIQHSCRILNALQKNLLLFYDNLALLKVTHLFKTTIKIILNFKIIKFCNKTEIQNQNTNKN